MATRDLECQMSLVDKVAAGFGRIGSTSGRNSVGETASHGIARQRPSAKGRLIVLKMRSVTATTARPPH